MDIKLNFINRSNDMIDSDIVIFGKSGETAIAWTVIQHCGPGDSHPFVYPTESSIGYSDSYGNYTPQLPALPGDQFLAVRTVSGDEIKRSPDPATTPDAIELRNTLPEGAISALVNKDGRLFAMQAGIAPQQTVAFQFQPVLWIGAASQVEQGQVMDTALLDSLSTQISLYGIRSADIVMTGGGIGPKATPLLFTLENVVLA